MVCGANHQCLTELHSITGPYIISGDNATFENLLFACALRGEGGIDTDLWLETDPMREDSDRWEWTNFTNDKLYPSFGDTIPDGKFTLV